MMFHLNDKKRRRDYFVLVNELLDELNNKITVNAEEIKSKTNNEKTKKYLEKSLKQIDNLIHLLDAYSVSPEEETNDESKFNKIIGKAHQELIKNLFYSITAELDLYINDEGVNNFFRNFIFYTSCCRGRSECPDLFKYIENEMKIHITPSSYLRSKDERVPEDFKKVENRAKNEIYKHMKGTGKLIPIGYTSSIDLLNNLRNISTHPNPLGASISGDFLFDIEPYGNFYISCNFIVILLYGYLEILDKWNRFLY